MRWPQLVSVLAVLVGSPLGAAAASPAARPTDPAARPPAAGPSQQWQAPDPGDAARRVLDKDVRRPVARRPGSAARIRTWPGRTIPYYETIPQKWDWSLDRAIEHWNTSGSRIRFVEVPKRRAQLVIRYGNTNGADGIATLGRQARNYVHLATRYKRSNEFDPETRVWVGRLFAHELGHVLGFDHTSGRCSLMTPVYDFGLCPPLPTGNPGYYHCRWIDKKLLVRFTRTYGGRPRRPAALCLIEPLPGALREVAFRGGNDHASPVRVTWAPPTRVLPGTRVLVTVWRGSACGSLPARWERRVAVGPSAGGWTDPAYGQGQWCYHLQIENRYGATRPGVSAGLPRFAPVPAAPAVGTPTWRRVDGGWRFTWRAPEPGMHLVAVRDDARPDRCVSSFEEDLSQWLTDLPGDSWQLSAIAREECLNLFVVTDWDTVGPPTQVRVVVPETPLAPAVGPRTWDPDESAFRFSWTAPDDFTSLMAMRNVDEPGTCVTVYDQDRAEWVQQDYDSTGYSLWSRAGSECVSLFAVTQWGSVSPRTQIVLQVPAPTAVPTVGPIGPWSGDPSYAASANVTLVDSPNHELGIEVLPGACPATPPASAEWFDGYEDWERPGRWYWYAEPWGDTGPQCVLLAAVDGYRQHGPVVAQTFRVPGA